MSLLIVNSNWYQCWLSHIGWIRLRFNVITGIKFGVEICRWHSRASELTNFRSYFLRLFSYSYLWYDNCNLKSTFVSNNDGCYLDGNIFPDRLPETIFVSLVPLYRLWGTQKLVGHYSLFTDRSGNWNYALKWYLIFLLF